MCGMAKRAAQGWTWHSQVRAFAAWAAQRAPAAVAAMRMACCYRPLRRGASQLAAQEPVRMCCRGRAAAAGLGCWLRAGSPSLFASSNKPAGDRHTPPMLATPLAPLNGHSVHKASCPSTASLAAPLEDASALRPGRGVCGSTNCPAARLAFGVGAWVGRLAACAPSLSAHPARQKRRAAFEFIQY